MGEIAAVGPVSIGNSARSHYNIPNDHVNPYGTVNPLFPLASGAAMGATLFGALHFIAWDFSFPTLAERWIWRASSISTVALPIFGVGLNIAFFRYIVPRLRRKGYVSLPGWIAAQMGWTISSIYVLARPFILVEVFRSLGFLPAEAFITTWSANIPHVG